MKGFEDLYGTSTPQEIQSALLSADDLVVLACDTAHENYVMPDYLKAVAILANKVAALDASISLLRHREPFAPFSRLFSEMEGAIEQLTASCMNLFEFATANNVLEVLDKDFVNLEDHEEE